MHISPRSWKTITAAALVALGVAGVGSSARAAQQFADGFVYSTGALGGDGPAVGAPAGQTAWTTSSGSTAVTTGSLTYPGLAATGNKATVTGVAGNNGDVSTAGLAAVGGGSGTEWVGFLVNETSGGSTPGGFGVLDLGYNGAAGPAFGMLFNQNVYGIDNDTADIERSATAIGVGATTHLFVAELNFATGMSYLFVDPSLNSVPGIASANASLAMTSAFKASGFNQITLAAGFNTAAFNLDQIKVGTTFVDAVPEPAAGTMTAAGVTLLAGWTWRRRRQARGGSTAR